MRPWFLSLLLLLAVSTVGDVVLAATCTPINQGTCYACKNCKLGRAGSSLSRQSSSRHDGGTIHAVATVGVA